MTTMLMSKVDELIQPNKRGKVTNAQMIPALVKAIEAGSKEHLDILKEGYPEVFEASSTKYLNKKHSAAFIKIMNGIPLDVEVIEVEVSNPVNSSEGEDNSEVEETSIEETSIEETQDLEIEDSTEEETDTLEVEVENEELQDKDQQPDKQPEVEAV